ncbi:hypothetical protein GCM10025867_04110 [Frondihabitans sucicola]|uniref:Glycosyltransferase family 1 protein n=1 Tax=Frondihabitans sucicola TaxID=1268041 RepID=A0ABN6XWY0_9MICO|nr:hypothetical protein [Frondihabitans sucicola]BDZ48170.1 hypothetical protein GCM10025867_04110 [Frondihabitans sucicola]
MSLREIDEPSVAGSPRVLWILRYVGALLAARRSFARESRTGIVLVTWPVLGYLDLAILRLTLGRRATGRIVLHDPTPLVSAVGYSPVVRRAVTPLLRRHRMIVHSSAAHAELDAGSLATATEILPHPLCERPRTSWPCVDSRPVVRVLGQYKADRDLELLAEIADLVGDRMTLEIHGRGWPEVPGWLVDRRFVSEAELDSLMSTSVAVLIPYRRFYQSGIANRCVELGVPFIGPRDSTLADLVPSESPLLVPATPRRGAAAARLWVEAVGVACSSDAAELRPLTQGAVRRSHRVWADWLTRQVATA